MNPDELTQLLVVEDFPETKVEILDVKDPYKPEIITETPPLNDGTTDGTDVIPNNTTTTPPVKTKNTKIKKIKTKNSDLTYDVKRPGDTTDYTKNLDSLIAKNDTTKKVKKGSDNTNKNPVDSTYMKIPDSLKIALDTNIVPVKFNTYLKALSFVKVTDSTSYFYIPLKDTTNKPDSTVKLASMDSLIVWFYVNSKEKEHALDNYRVKFYSSDTLNIFTKDSAFSKPQAGRIKHYYIVLGKTDRINVNVDFNEAFFNLHKQLRHYIEEMLKSISFRRPPKK